MKPHRLEATAFGPFGQTVRVDFDAFTGAGLFHVHGPTGAGKTSILDGVCFALFGSVPGTRRPEQLRSDHASAGTETVVELEFSLGAERFRIRRAPRQERSKRRGVGTTVQPEAAQLWRRDPTGSWRPAATGAAEVDAAVRDLLGLTATQFQQVVVLPQGRFEEALLATTDRRRDLLRSLFDTERFAAATARLVDEAAALEGELARRRGTVELIEARATERAAAAGVAEGDASRPPADLAGAVRAAHETAERTATRAADDLARATVDLERAVEAAERRRRREASQAVVAAWDETARDRAAREQRLARARAAAALAPLRAERDRAAEDAAARRGEVAAALDRAGTPAAGVPRSAGAETLGAARGAVEDRLRELSDLLAASQLARDADSEARRLEGVAEAAAVEARQAGERAAAVAERHAALEKALDEARAAQRALPDLEERAGSLARSLEAVEGLAARATAASAATLKADDRRRRADGAREAHLAAMEARIRGMAGELASELRAGDPCPVCGSTSHPSPAAPSAAGDPATIATAEAHAREAGRAAEEALAGAQKALGELEAARASAGLAPGDPLPDDGEIDARRVAARDAGEALDRDRRTAARVDALTAGVERSAEDRDQARLDAEEAARRAASAAALAGDRRLAATAAAAAAEAAARAVVLDDGGLDDGGVSGIVTGSHEEVIVAAERLTVAAAALGDATTAATAAELSERRHVEACERFAAGLAAAGFAREDDLDEAGMRPAALEALARDLDDERARVRAAQAELASPDATDDVDALEPDEARLRVARCREVHTDGCTRAAMLETAAAELDRLAADHARASASCRSIESEAALARRVADVCRGAGNDRQQALESYVLAAFFEEIAEVAGRRLSVMTGGRFGLRHTDLRQPGHRSAGLDLVVTDAWTGAERPPGSLSGGELFQASLALALALAEVVQRHAGGVRIDALFVDEGFGSLDADALELAMAELDALRAGGRTVGVISHVPALRERIGAGLEVISGPQGSSVRIVGAGTGLGS